MIETDRQTDRQTNETDRQTDESNQTTDESDGQTLLMRQTNHSMR